MIICIYIIERFFNKKYFIPDLSFTLKSRSSVKAFLFWNVEARERHKAGWHDTALTSPMQPAEFCSLSEQPGWVLQFVNQIWKRLQYNIVMIGSKDEEIFFLFLPSLRKLHTRTLLGHGFVSFVAKKRTCSIKIQLDQCNVAVVCMYFTWCIIERYFEFQEQEVKLGQLEYNLVKLVI